MKVKVTQSCPTLCNPMDYIVHGILQARILEWLAFPFSKGSSQPRDGTQVSHIAGGIFTSWATREAQEYWSGKPIPSPADLPNPGIEPGSPASQADSLPTELNWEKGFVIVQQTRSLQIFLWLFLNTSGLHQYTPKILQIIILTAFLVDILTSDHLLTHYYNKFYFFFTIT